MSDLGGLSAYFPETLPLEGLNPKKAVTKEQADKAGKEFESMFIAQMLGPMFGESTGDAAFGSEESAEIYKGLMIDVYAKEIARSGGIGIASYVSTELLKLQETAP